jgi:hypothetical protein
VAHLRQLGNLVLRFSVQDNELELMQNVSDLMQSLECAGLVGFALLQPCTQCSAKGTPTGPAPQFLQRG